MTSIVTFFIITSLTIVYFFTKFHPENLAKQLLMVILNALVNFGFFYCLIYIRDPKSEALVRISIDSHQILKFDVELGEIPMDYEVTANFFTP